MTQQIDPPRISPVVPPAEPAARVRTRRAWWRRPWMIPLVVIVAAVLLYIWPHYIGLDRRNATTSLPPNHPLKYPILVAHIFFGSLALITMVLQVWPRLRARRPKLHRIAGRFYVFGAVLPSAVMATILLTWLGGPGWIGRITLGVLWVLSTGAGYRAARRRRWEDHRRYMIYSFALTLDAFSTRFLQFVILSFIPKQHLDVTVTLEAISWCGWLFNLLVAHWWITRTARSRSRVIVAS
jgi:uncharacterized membrane protein YozB (DUF420 family)